MPLPQPPPQARMGDGRYAPAQVDFGRGPPDNQKFLIVIQYYDGDVAEAEDLANIIADLERVRNKDADIMLFGRYDAKPFPSHTKAKLESKFEKVHEVRCRSRDGNTYPFASNCMWYDLVTLLGQYPQWNQPYFAFINLESDCVPVHPGWIGELIHDFKIAQVHGKHCIGHVNTGHHTPHMNGLAVYAIDIYAKVPGGKLSGGDLAVAYDLYHAKNLLPIAYDSPFIAMDYRVPTITAADLFKPRKGGIEPALYHGVKDASAREAVKARHITFSEQKDISRTTVFTYYNSDTDIGHGESNEVLELWRQGWKSRGWNPVVLRLMDAVRNPRYVPFLAAISRFPYVGDKKIQVGGFLRWLALDTVGGGLLVKMDELPNGFTPSKLDFETWNRETLKKLIDGFIDYTIQPKDMLQGQMHVTDEAIVEFGSLAVDYGSPGFRDANIVSFSELAIAASPMRGKRKSDVMAQYLRGN